MARASHALATEGAVWVVDPVDWPEAIDRALTLGRPAAVLQLLDRHNRDCAAARTEASDTRNPIRDDNAFNICPRWRRSAVSLLRNLMSPT